MTSQQHPDSSAAGVDAAGSAGTMQEWRANSVDDPLAVREPLGTWLQDVRTRARRRTGAAPRRERNGLGLLTRAHADTCMPVLRVGHMRSTRIAATD